MDCLTKYIILIPYKMGDTTLTVDNTVQLLFPNIVRCFGVPLTIISDKDPHFVL